MFKNEREFYKQFPSGFFICSNCGYMNNSKYRCIRCGYRADGLFKTMGKGFKYKITDTNKIYEIFKPIELEKGNNTWQKKN